MKRLGGLVVHVRGQKIDSYAAAGMPVTVAQNIGGEVIIEGIANKGTRVFVSIPG